MRASQTSALALIIGLTATVLAVAPGSAEVPDSRFLFNKRCALCHDATALAARLEKLPDDAKRREFLAQFLPRHHTSDDEERALIIDYLLRHQPRQ